MLTTALVAGCVTPAGEENVDANVAETPGSRSSVNVEITHDHRTQDARTVTFDIPEDAGPVTFRTFFAAEDVGFVDVCKGPTHLRVTAPDGSTYADHEMDDTSISVQVRPVGGWSMACGPTTHHEGVVLPPGEWSVAFDGNGMAVGTVTIVNA